MAIYIRHGEQSLVATRSMREAPPCRWIAFCSLYHGGNFFERSDKVGIEVNESPGGWGGRCVKATGYATLTGTLPTSKRDIPRSHQSI